MILGALFHFQDAYPMSLFLCPIRNPKYVPRNWMLMEAMQKLRSYMQGCKVFADWVIFS